MSVERTCFQPITTIVVEPLHVRSCLPNRPMERLQQATCDRKSRNRLVPPIGIVRGGRRRHLAIGWSRVLKHLRSRLRPAIRVGNPQPKRQELGMPSPETRCEFTLPRTCTPPFLDTCVGQRSWCPPAHHQVLHTDVTGRTRRVRWHGAPVDPTLSEKTQKPIYPILSSLSPVQC